MIFALLLIGAVLTPDEKEPLAVIVTAPSGRSALSSSELIGVVGEILERHTDLAARVAPPELVEECRGAIDCLAPRARAEIKDARLLLVLSVLPGERGDSAAALLVDIEQKRELAPLARAELGTREEAEQFLSGLFTGAFAAALAERGHLSPYAEVALTNEHAGATLRVDGEPKGTLEAGTTTLRLRSGPRTIAVEADGYAAWTTTIVVARGAHESIAAHLSELPGEGAAHFSTGVLWAGVGLGVTGGVITAYALAKRDGEVDTLCLYAGGDRRASCGEGSRFVTSSYDADAALEGRARLNPRGVMLAPLGLSLAATGLTWTLSMLLFDRKSTEVPILELAIGVGLGAAIYGVSALANGTSVP